ncbi:membrane protein [Shigella phage Silverhawkium]|uniref:Membrane protein n=1 Tax=Shigella phage Silverhawkium TaxID=2530185 RepID=A0A482JK45_9CAUD|nr:membrane protein [Shigella phage Silverhawkium]
MLEKIINGFKVDAVMLLIIIFTMNMFIDFKQGFMFGVMLVWLIFEILEIHLDLSGKLKKFLDKVFKKN